MSDPPNSLQAQQSFTMGEESLSFQPSKSHEAADSVLQSVHFGRVGISHSVLEPEPSGLGHVELLKSILTCASPSCHCSHLFKNPCAWNLSRNLSPSFHTNIKTKHTAQQRKHKSHLCLMFLPQPPPAEASLGVVNSRGG